MRATVTAARGNIDSSKEEWNEVLAFAQTGISDEIVEVEDECGNILKCTPSHKVFTKNRGYIDAADLKENDKISFI